MCDYPSLHILLLPFHLTHYYNPLFTLCNDIIFLTRTPWCAERWPFSWTRLTPLFSIFLLYNTKENLLLIHPLFVHFSTKRNNPFHPNLRTDKSEHDTRQQKGNKINYNSRAPKQPISSFKWSKWGNKSSIAVKMRIGWVDGLIWPESL